MPGACAVYDAIDGELLSRIVLSVATCCSVIRVCSSVPCWRVPVFAPLKASHRPCARFLPPRASLALMTLCCNLWSGHREAQAHPLWLSLAPARWLYRSAALAAPRLACERDDAAAALTLAPCRSLWVLQYSEKNITPFSSESTSRSPPGA